MSGLLSRPVVAVASPEDATATANAVEPYLSEFGDLVLLHVIEKGGGVMDKASVEQREEHAEEAFAAFRAALSGAHDDFDPETDIVYDTDIADGIITAAGDLDASAIVFTSRGGGWLLDFLSGDVRGDLLEQSDRPVIALPEPPGGSES